MCTYLQDPLAAPVTLQLGYLSLIISNAEQEETKDDNVEEQLLNAQVNQAGMGFETSAEKADA